MAKRVKIPGRLESAETGNIVTGADAVMDDEKGKTQVVINSEVDAAIINLAQGKQDNLTFDSAPTEGSPNPVTSAGVYTADKVLSDAIEAILLLIPSAASALNKLVDMQTMNSSIATATASFKGTYNLVSDLHLGVDATHEQIGAALDALSLDADNNDYAFVQVPNSATAPTEISKTERYKYNGENWLFEYDLNNSGFTSPQWNAINSGVTSLLVGKLSDLPTNAELTTLLAGKQDNLTFDNVPTAGSPNPVKSGGVYARNNEIVALINALDVAKQDVLTFDNAPVQGSPNPVKSGGVYTAISAVQAAVVALDAAKQNVLTFDSTPTLGSPNPVTSSGIKTELNRIDGNITTLNDLYEALTQSALVVVQPTDTWPVASPATKTIYRVVDRVNTPPQYYSDYMWNGSAMVLMATYDNAIDAEPTAESHNLVESGGVFDALLDIAIKSSTIISSSYLEDHPEITSVLDLPRNKVYAITSDVTEQIFLGLPVYSTYGTLFVYNPEHTPAQAGYSVFEYTVRGGGGKPVRYRTFTYNDATPQNLVWDKIDENTLLEADVTAVNSEFLTNNPNITNFLGLPTNKVYRIEPLPSSFGLPSHTYGTLESFVPKLASETSVGFRIYRFSCIDASGELNLYWTFLNSDSTISNVNWMKIHNNEDCVMPSEIKITAQYLEDHPEIESILDLPKNKIYAIGNDVGASFGIPIGGNNAVLMIYSPYKSGEGWSVFRFTYNVNLTNTRTFIAHSWVDTESLSWQEIYFDSEVVKSTSVTVDANYLQNNPSINTFLDLPTNSIYSVNPGLPASFGLPVNAYGTLLVYTPFGSTAERTGYRVYELLAGNEVQDIRRYWCYCYDDALLDNTVWREDITSRATKKIFRKIGLTPIKMAFLGDSIVAGEGSSDFNGGPTGTSGHLIPNNIKTYYRNTGTKCWVNRMISYITSKYSNTICVNNGIGGFSAAQVYSNIGTLAVDDNGNTVDVIILSVGTNDRNSNNKIGVISDNIVNIANWCSLHDVELIVLTNSPLLNLSAPNNEQTVQSAIIFGANKAGVECVNVLSEINYYLEINDISVETIYTDTLHPNDIGYELMFKIIKKGLKI